MNRHLPVRVSIGTWWCWWLFPSLLATLWRWFGSWRFMSLGRVVAEPGGRSWAVVVLKHHRHGRGGFTAGGSGWLGALLFWKANHRTLNTRDWTRPRNQNIIWTNSGVPSPMSTIFNPRQRQTCTGIPVPQSSNLIRTEARQIAVSTKHHCNSDQSQTDSSIQSPQKHHFNSDQS